MVSTMPSGMLTFIIWNTIFICSGMLMFIILNIFSIVDAVVTVVPNIDIIAFGILMFIIFCIISISGLVSSIKSIILSIIAVCAGNGTSIISNIIATASVMLMLVIIVGQCISSGMLMFIPM